jgi:phosphoglycerol transferase MdoB-like AlkP superfamily enzyme
MQEKTRKLLMSCSLIVAGIVSIFAILFAANQQTFGWAFNVAFWVLICYVALSLLIWLFYGILSLKDKPKKTLIFAVTIIVVLVASVLLSLGDSMPQEMLLRYESTEKTAKLIAIACYITYFTIGGAVVMLLWSIISKQFKK